MWSAHVLPKILVLSALWTVSNGETQVTVSWHNTCLLHESDVYCWGDGSNGILGTGDSSPLYEPPAVPINLGDDFAVDQMKCGNHHCCGISSNKTLKCWGANSFGQLGQGDANNRGDDPGEMGDNLSITHLGSDFDVEQVSCGEDLTCVLSTNHETKCFGRNDYGQLGYGNRGNIGDGPNEMGDNLSVLNMGPSFVPIQGECSFMVLCEVYQHGKVVCGGRNKYGQLGRGDTNNRGANSLEIGDNVTAIDLGKGFYATQITVGWANVCALSIDHDTKCWGRNDDGQLGLGDTNNRGDSGGQMGDALSRVHLGTKFVTEFVVGGRAHTLALSNNGSLKAWGRNDHGQLGYGDMNNRGGQGGEMGNNLPFIDVGAGFTVADVSSNFFAYHSCALLENGTSFLGLKCWGGNHYGQLGLGDTENRGDEANEMGDDLPFVSFVFAAVPTQFPTTEPTEDPTTEPTTHPILKPTNINIFDKWTILHLLVVILMVFLCIIIVIMWKMTKKESNFRKELSQEINTISKHQRANKLETRQGVIACIAVGKYDGSDYSNLPVSRDVENLRKFSKFMGYDFIERPNKLYWTKRDVTSFLMDDIGNSLFRQNGEPKHDVLIICFTGHGLRDRVVTSDCQLMDRTAIHRMISMKYPKIRDVPRIFVFDVCAGWRQCIPKGPGPHHVVAVSSEDATDNISVNGNDADEDDVKDVQARTTKNPDYKMVVINSANNGFQAHMRRDEVGSLLIYLFTKKLRKNVENHDQKCLAEIMDIIQKELHDGKKQQIECIFNNGTRNLVLEMKRKRFINVL